MLGLRNTPASSLQRGAHAQVSAERFQFRPLVGLGFTNAAALVSELMEARLGPFLGWQSLNGSLPLTFTPGWSQRLAGPLTPVPVAAACNHAFVIPSAVHRAAVLVDNRLPPRPVKTLSLGLRYDTERKASTARRRAGSAAQRGAPMSGRAVASAPPAAA